MILKGLPRIAALSLACVLILLAACTTDLGEFNETSILTQTALNNASKGYMTNITGAYRDTVRDIEIDFAHDTTENAGLMTFRDVFTNHYKLTGQVGDIVTLRIYNRDTTTGSRGDKRLGVYVMHKRQRGYFREGGDWEYAYITDTTGLATGLLNGILPANEGVTRGKLQDCAGCHAQADRDDFLFSNDKP